MFCETLQSLHLSKVRHLSYLHGREHPFLFLRFIIITALHIHLKEAVKFYHFTVGEFAGVQDVIISGTGYTGAGGFEIYVKNEDAARVWEQIFKAGDAYDIKPIGLGARDTLRLEAGMPLYGHELSEQIDPFTAGLGFAVNLIFTRKIMRHDPVLVVLFWMTASQGMMALMLALVLVLVQLMLLQMLWIGRTTQNFYLKNFIHSYGFRYSG